MSSERHSRERYREIRNSKVLRDYKVEETFEAGIMLTGTEVKSIRQGQASINDAFCRLDHGRPVLYQSHIAEYFFGNFANHNPYRPRRLLLHAKEIRQLRQDLDSGGRTLIPIKLYFKQALVKVQLGLCRGKKMYDKREDLRRKTALREAQRAIR